MAIVSGIATDNLPNRNWGRFSLQELYSIAKLLEGCPVSEDHNTSYSSKKGEVIRAWVEVGDYNPEIQESYGVVKFEAEIDQFVEAGDGISIAASYQSERCANCDCDIHDWARCPRPLEQIKLKWIERVGVNDVFELSLVLIPAVKSAKVLDNGENTEEPQEQVMEAPSKYVVNSVGITSHDVVDGDPPKIEKSGVTLTDEEVELINQERVAVALELEKLKTELAAAKAAADEASAKVAEMAAAAAAEEKRSKLGLSMPSVNTLLSTRRDRSDGLAAEFQSILDQSPQRTCFYGEGTRLLVQRDEVEATKFWLENRQALSREMQQVARDHGLLRGVLSRDAATVKTDIPDMLLTHLSMMVRTTHQSGKIFWQFPRMKEDFTKVPGDVVNVPRWANITAPTAESDFTLTPGTALSTTPQNLSESSRPITLEEKGLGKSGVSGFAPIGIPEFIAARSIEDLQTVVMERLGLHYEECEDFMIRSKYQTTTAIRYNDNGTTTATPGNVNIGDDGTLSEDFLMDLYSEMSSNQIPTYDDGNYIGALNPKAAAQLRKSVGDRIRYATPVEISSVLKATETTGKISGYIGTVAGFHLFQTNVYGVGTSGEGVQTVSLGVGSTLTRSSWFFGKDAVGLGIGLPVTIRANDDTSFGRLQQYIWLAHMGCATLDVDPSNNASEQLRVFQVRTIDVAI